MPKEIDYELWIKVVKDHKKGYTNDVIAARHDLYLYKVSEIIRSHERMKKGVIKGENNNHIKELL